MSPKHWRLHGRARGSTVASSRFASSGGSAGSTAGDFFIDWTNGSNSTGFGIFTNPWRSFTHASTSIPAGSTVYARAGTYDEELSQIAIPSGSTWNTVTRFANYNGETVWISPATGQNAVNFTSTDHFIEFDGINMRGPAPGAVFTVGSSGTQVHHIRLRNAQIVNDFSGGGVGSIFGYANDCQYSSLVLTGPGGVFGIYLKGSSNLIEHCEMSSVGGDGVQIYDGTGDPRNNIVRGCYIHDISTYDASGIGESQTDVRRWGIIIGGHDNYVYNNVIARISNNSSAVDIKAIQVFSGSSNHVWNNTITGCEGYSIRIESGVTNCEIFNNISWNNTLEMNDQGSGNTFQTNSTFNPHFVSSTDFHLTAASTSIDEGTTISTVTTDRDGVSRPQGAGYDLGAYEYIP